MRVRVVRVWVGVKDRIHVRVRDKVRIRVRVRESIVMVRVRNSEPYLVNPKFECLVFDFVVLN